MHGSVDQNHYTNHIHLICLLIQCQILQAQIRISCAVTFRRKCQIYNIPRALDPSDLWLQKLDLLMQRNKKMSIYCYRLPSYVLHIT